MGVMTSFFFVGESAGETLSQSLEGLIDRFVGLGGMDKQELQCRGWFFRVSG